MPHKVVGIRVDKRGDRMKISSIGQSARGTKFLIRSVEVRGPFESKEVRENYIRSRIDDLLPAGLG